MSEAAAVSAPSTPLAPEIDGGPNAVIDVPDAESGGTFGSDELEAVRERAQKILKGEDPERKKPGPKPKPKAVQPPPDEDADDPDAVQAKPANDEEAEPAKPKATPKPTEDEDPDLVKRRKDVSDEEGRIDDEKLSNAFAKLHSQEKRFKARIAEERAAFQTERSTYQAERQAYEAERQAFEATKERGKQSPLSALKEIGWTWEQLTQYVASQGQIPVEKVIQDLKLGYDAELKKLADDTQATRRAHEEAQTAHHATQFQQRFEGEVRALYESEEYAEVRAFADRVAKEEGFKNGLEYAIKHSLDNVAGVWKGKRKVIAAKEIFDYYKSDLQKRRELFGGAPGQAGADTTAKTPAAVKPITNDATSERTRRASTDDAPWTEEDAEEARKKALQVLRGG